MPAYPLPLGAVGLRRNRWIIPGRGRIVRPIWRVFTLESRPCSPYHGDGPRVAEPDQESKRPDTTGIAMSTKRQQVWIVAAWILGASGGGMASAEAPRAVDDRLT